MNRHVIPLLCLVVFHAAFAENHAADVSVRSGTFKKTDRSRRSVSSCGSTPRNCEAWRVLGVDLMRSYTIDPDGVGGVPPFRIRCDMTKIPAIDIVIHNHPSRTLVKNTPEYPSGKLVNIVYGDANVEQLTALMSIDGDCNQSLLYECYNAVISGRGIMQTTWLSRTGKKMRYWPGGPPGGYGCACGIDKTCAGGVRQVCNCEKNDNVWRSDGGNVTDKESLPITALFLTDTNERVEKAYYTLGRLKCQGKKEAEKSFDVHFCDADNYKGIGHWVLPAKILADFATNPFCLGISETDPANLGSYDLTVDLMAARHHNGVGHAGVIFNVVDEVNYDLVWIAPSTHAGSQCYEYGFVKNGLYKRIRGGTCRRLKPVFHSWFPFKVEMRQSGDVTFRLNGGWMVSTSLKAHFHAFRRGGVLTVNRVQNMALFKNYHLRPRCD